MILIIMDLHLKYSKCHICKELTSATQYSPYIKHYSPYSKMKTCLKGNLVSYSVNYLF